MSDIVVLEPFPRLQAAKGLAVVFIPVEDAAGEEAEVDEVEGVGGPDPVLVCVVDFEGYVGRGPSWLNKGYICSEDLDGAVDALLIGKVAKEKWYWLGACYYGTRGL